MTALMELLNSNIDENGCLRLDAEGTKLLKKWLIMMEKNEADMFALITEAQAFFPKVMALANDATKASEP